MTWGGHSYSFVKRSWVKQHASSDLALRVAGAVWQFAHFPSICSEDEQVKKFEEVTEVTSEDEPRVPS